jgi:non-specific serine/threonine protein kinase
MTLDEIVDYTVGASNPSRPPSNAPATGPLAEALTPRQREVAGLVARGLSNKEIATTLVISQRTAESHIANMLDKLGFTTRAQIAAWVAAAGPTAAT